MKVIMGKKYYDIEDIAKEFEKSEPTIYRWIKDGKLKGRKCGNQILFTEEDVGNFMESQAKGDTDAVHH